MSVINRQGIYQISLFFDLGRGRERLLVSSGCRDKRAAETMARKIRLLVDARVAGEQPRPELAQWVDAVPNRVRRALVKKGIIDSDRAANAAPIGQHVAEYLKWSEIEEGQGRTHLQNKRTQLNRIIEFMKIHRLSEITRDKVLAYRRHVKAKPSGNSNATINRHVAVFQAFLNWCVDQGRLHVNPVGRVRRLDEEADRRRPRRPYTPEEVRALLKVAAPYRRLVYLFAVYTGLRHGEIKKTRVGNLDLKARTLRVSGRVDKEGKSATLPLHADLVDALSEYLPTRGGPSEPLFDRVPRIQTLRRDLRKAGIARYNEEDEQLDFHALRTTLATELIRAGVPLSNAKLLTRHASTKVLEKNYVKLIHPDAEAAMSALPSLIKSVEGSSDAERRALEVDMRPNEETSGDRAQHGIEPAPNGAPDAARCAPKAAATDFDRRERPAGERSEAGRIKVADEIQVLYPARLGSQRRQPAASGSQNKRKTLFYKDLRAVGAAG